jgi:anaerobic selenocysteine-containing dehydrogenase
MQKTRTACPLDCFAHCGLLATVENGRVTRIEGDPEHPVNRGLICGKGRTRHLQRMYHPERITTPLLRSGRSGAWQAVSWDTAYEIIADRVTAIIARYGPTALLHLDNEGSAGILKTLSRRFFNALGGCSRPTGSLCWGSGCQAQTYDFGRWQIHGWEDLLNSRLIVLWGRDPASTNIHLMPLLKKARERGARVVVINPVRVASCANADRHVAPRPGSDGALALAVAHELIGNGWVDQRFIDRHVKGYEEFRRLVETFPPERAAAVTGVPVEEIRALAREYGNARPACILFGFGLQRYANGGQTIRAIDALAAITGNIGVPGGGANYGGEHWTGLIAPITGAELAREERFLPWPTLADAMLEARDPPVRGIFVTRCNPVTQAPQTVRVKEAFARSEFTVVTDFFLTDTAQMADMVLPCTSFLEAEDVVFGSWNHYLTYAPPVVPPRGECRSDFEIFAGLARHMGLDGFPDLDGREWLARALAPLAAYGITLETLRKGPVRNPAAPEVPWQDGVFFTPSGKFELYSERAAADGLDPLPVYVEPVESPLRDAVSAQEYPFHLITAHHAGYLHSQFWNMTEEGRTLQRVYLHPEAAAACGIRDGQPVRVATRHGALVCRAAVTDRVRRDTVLIYQGSWAAYGGGVNVLTPQYLPDMGLGTPFYDCMCRLIPLTQKAAGQVPNPS